MRASIKKTNWLNQISVKESKLRWHTACRLDHSNPALEVIFFKKTPASEYCLIQSEHSTSSPTPSLSGSQRVVKKLEAPWKLEPRSARLISPSLFCLKARLWIWPADRHIRWPSPNGPQARNLEWSRARRRARWQQPYFPDPTSAPLVAVEGGWRWRSGGARTSAVSVSWRPGEVGSSPDCGGCIVYSSLSRFIVHLSVGFFPFTITAYEYIYWISWLSVSASVSSSQPVLLLLLVAAGPYPSSHRRGRCRAAPASSAPAGRPRQLAGLRLLFDVCGQGHPSGLRPGSPAAALVRSSCSRWGGAAGLRLAKLGPLLGNSVCSLGSTTCWVSFQICLVWVLGLLCSSKRFALQILSCNSFAVFLFLTRFLPSVGGSVLLPNSVNSSLDLVNLWLIHGNDVVILGQFDPNSMFSLRKLDGLYFLWTYW
jgi:hypothetical protein